MRISTKFFLLITFFLGICLTTYANDNENEFQKRKKISQKLARIYLPKLQAIQEHNHALILYWNEQRLEAAKAYVEAIEQYNKAYRQSEKTVSCPTPKNVQKAYVKLSNAKNKLERTEEIHCQCCTIRNNLASMIRSLKSGHCLHFFPELKNDLIWLMRSVDKKTEREEFRSNKDWNNKAALEEQYKKDKKMDDEEDAIIHIIEDIIKINSEICAKIFISKDD